MKLHRLRSYADFCSYRQREGEELSRHEALLAALVPPNEQPFEVKGFSYVAGQEVRFLVDFLWSGVKGRVNWRDRVCCPVTGFTNRWRATIHLFDIEVDAYPDSSIYMSEQVTPLFRYFTERYQNVIGSEYLGGKYKLGELNSSGVRNESLCALSFADKSFDIVLSFDVIEHIPDPSSVFNEIYRVLRPRGRLHWTVPFSPNSEKNVVRARMNGENVEHLFPPEYHGDPLSESGVLCFTHFGWEMLEMARSAGFRDVYAIAFHAAEFAYLSEQFQFFALK
jgi:SAM-dependent methyltransferase